jgi:hypothetical protein
MQSSRSVDGDIGDTPVRVVEKNKPLGSLL